MSVIIDIKTGKAEPWAALQTAAYSLFNNWDVEFDEANHIYRYNGLVFPSVTKILKCEGFIDTRFYDDWSRDKGSFVHQAIKYDLAGELDEENLDEEIRPYLAAFRKFIAESHFVYDKSEIPGVNTTYSYCGTPDLVGFFPYSRAFRYALELNREGKYKLIPFTDRNDSIVWLAAVACYHWKQNNLKGK